MPSLGRFARQRAAYYESLSDAQKLAQNDIEKLIDDNRKLFQTKRDGLTQELNQNELHRVGYISVAVSFIVSGMLSSQLGVGETLAAKVLFLAAIVLCLFTAIMLLLEYSATYRLFKMWDQANGEIIEYIEQGDWTDPQGLSLWIQDKQANLPNRTSTLVSVTEFSSLILAFIALSLWVTERLFNPDWLPWW